MSAQLRMLYASNAFWAASGYGVQGRSLLPRLAELPEFGGEPGSMAGRENIAQFAWYGLEGGIHAVDGFRVYPRFDDPYGNDAIGAHVQHFGANVVTSLIDVWVMHDTDVKVKPALWCPWLPIDHDPVPDAFLQSLRGAYLPLTYAKWGHKLLTKAGVENVYIPHGVEPTIFKVLANRDNVQQFKRQITGLEHSHLSVMVAANKGFPDRKWHQGQLECFRDFAKDKPEARLYMHTLPLPIHGGLDLAYFVRSLGMDFTVLGDANQDPQAQVIFPQPYMYRIGYPPEYLTMVYNAADVLLSASMSEGFGIPIIEAQACGAPVVVTDFSAMPELVRWGHLVDVDHLILTGMHSYQAWPSKRSMVDKLQRLYEAWTVCGGDWPISKRLETSKAIHDEYGWNRIVQEHWQPLVARLAQDAPPLDGRFQAAVPDVRPDDVGSFVAALNEGSQQEQQPRLKRRVEPLVSVPLNGNGEAVTA